MIAPDALAADRYLIARLRSGPSKEVPLLDGMAVFNAATAMMVLGRASLFGARQRWLQLTPQVRADCMSEGLRVARGWPAELNAVLDRMSDYTPCRSKSPQGVYGYLEIRLAWCGDPEFEPIREAVRQHALRTMPISPRTRLFQHQLPGALLTLRRLSAELGISSGLLIKAACRHGLAAIGTLGDATIVDERLAAQLRDLFADTCSFSEACERLGVRRELLEKLIEAGLVSTIYPTIRREVRRFKQKTLQDFCHRLKRARRCYDKAPPGTALVWDVVHRLGQDRLSVIQAIVDRRIACIGYLRDRPGISGLLIDVEQGRQMLSRQSDDRVLLLAEAAEQLRMYPRAVKLFEKQGVLEKRYGNLKFKRGIGFCPRSVARLRATVVSASALATAFQPATHATLVMKKLKAQGISPIGPGAHSNLFARGLAITALGVETFATAGGRIRQFNGFR